MTSYPNIKATLVDLHKLQEVLKLVETIGIYVTSDMTYALDDAITILKELQPSLTK